MKNSSKNEEEMTSFFKLIQKIHFKIRDNLIVVCTALLLLGVSLYILQEANYLTPHSSFGSGDSVDTVIGLLGLSFIFYFIPFLLQQAHALQLRKKEFWPMHLGLGSILYIFSLIFQLGLGHVVLVSVPIGNFFLLYLSLKYIYLSRANTQTCYFWVLLVLTTTLGLFAFRLLKIDIIYNKRVLRMFISRLVQ